VTDATDADTLQRIVTVAEFEPLARAVMDPAAFDYVAGGSWDEQTLADNDAAWRRRRLRPRVLVDMADVDPSTTMLDAKVAMPVAIAPMATQALAHPDGELAMTRAAARAGVPMILSTTSSSSIEETAAAAPDAVRWFQLYTQADPAVSRSLVERAADAGYGAVVVTVDLPVLGYRDRDRRSGFELPPLGNFRDAGPTHGDHRRASIEDRLWTGLTWADLATIRSWSSLPIVLKGILTAEDARLAVEHGVEAIVVSNHGARQLDRVAATADVLGEVVAAVGGRTEVWVDGGIRRGLDVVMALALGARGVLVGRPAYWALAAAGQAGVERAMAILREETEIALALLGARTPLDVRPEHIVATGPTMR
jgi:isopentenyl diphosphate isomerase/L-lactate dehydrogenase-like FMN-dependent dehydrogenase